VLAATTVALHIAYPLTGGELRRQLTIWSVVTFGVSSLLHIGSHHGVRGALALLGCGAGIGWAAEAVGVATGFPFGRYEYTGTLGWKLAGVVVIVPVAWAMMAWPALLAGRRTRHPVLVGGAVLVTWDLFLDPQMVDAGHWIWEPSRWPDLHGIPVSNSFGWVLTSLLVLGSLDRLVPRSPRPDERVPFALLAWTFWSSVIGFVVFFDRPTVTLVAGPAMALALAPAVRGFLADPPPWWRRPLRLAATRRRPS
jgi:uncharacterized membrane protein